MFARDSISFLISGLLALGCASAFAAERPGSDEEPIDVSSAVSIDEIVVTATRREASLASVPLSVHVLTAEQLENMGAANFRDYARTVPGLYFTDSGFGGESHTIRGVSTMIGSEINPATSIYVDDVPVTHAGGFGLPYSPDPMLVDIERIEILRGPQGTLFGASSMGGALRIIPVMPDPVSSDGFIEAELATIADGGFAYDLRGMVNTPFAGEEGAIRLVGYYRDADGFIDNEALGRRDVNSDETVGGRLAMSWQPNDRFSITGKVIHQVRESAGTDTDDFVVPDRHQFRQVPEPNQDEWSLYNLIVDLHFDWGNLISSTALLDRALDTRLDTTDFLTQFFDTGTTMTAVNEEAVREYTQEFRAFSPADNRFHWLLGAFFQDQELDFSQKFPSPGFDDATGGLASQFGPADILYQGSSIIELQQIAAFGEVGYHITDAVDVTLGARWFDIDRGYSSDATGFFNGGPGSAAGRASENGVMPKASISYRAGPDTTIYATAAKGFRPGSVNPPEASDLPECVAELAALGYSEFPIAYDSDSLWSYEAGVRSTLAGGRVHLSGAFYRIDWSDMQSSNLLNCGIAFIENAGEVVNDGVELAMSAQPIDMLQVDLTASYIHARLAEDSPNFAASKGDRVPGVPEFSGAIGVTVELPETAGIGHRVRLDYQYVDSSFSAFSTDWRQRMPSYTVTNVRYSLSGARWSGALFLENAFDERGIVFISEGILGSWETTIPPRRLGLALRRAF